METTRAAAFVLSDERRSRIVRLSSVVVGGFVVFTMVSLQLFGMTETRRLIGNALVLLGMAAANLLCRAGRVSAGAQVLVWTTFAGVVVVCYATGGFRSPSITAFLAIVTFAGWLLGVRPLLQAIALSLLAMLALFVLGQAGELPAPAPSRPFLQFATVSLTLIAGGLLFYFVLREMHRSWGGEIALRKHLERANDELELKVAQRTQELSLAKEAAEQASRAKGAFLANMSHEIRTPMHAILGLTEVVRRESTDPRARERLALVAKASDHLLMLINNVLDVSKIESGKLELAIAEMRVSDVFERVLAVLGDEAQRRGLQLRAELDVDASRAVLGDATRLTQVLLNFAANALKFTPSGEVTLRCRALNRSRFRFEVQDSGIGIAPADQARIFESFEQADGAPNRTHTGSGLGLTINRHLVRAMDGEVGLQSTPAQGSVFWFTARFAPAPVAAVTRADADMADAQAQLRAALVGARLLVVDDNEVNRIVARAQLNAVGIEPDDAADGAEALAMAGRTSYDLILMDVHMPTLDGIEATRRIRAIDGYRDTPIIALTADAFHADRERFLQAGMSDHLAKPLRSGQLYGALLRWLQLPAGGTPS